MPVHEISVRSNGQGLHEFTPQVSRAVTADPSAPHDLEGWLNWLVPENDPHFTLSRRRWNARLRAAAWTAAIVLALSACGGSTGGGGGGPTAPGPSIIFIPDRAAGANSVSMGAGDGSVAPVLELEIVATEMVNVQAIDFVLAFPGDLFRFDGFERGDFIGAGAQVIITGGGSALTFQLLRTVPTPASGTGTVITLTFTAVAGGNGRFDFLDPLAEDLFGVEIQAVDWIGGAVQVTL